MVSDQPSTAPSAKSGAEPATTARKGTPSKDSKKKTYPWWIELPIILVVTMLILGAFNLFVGRLYLIPSESMEPTLNGCAGCDGDRIFVNKLAYLGDSSPHPGDVVVFRGPDSWNGSYTSQRSRNDVIRGIQNAASVVGIIAPDENTLVKRVVATGGQTVQCRAGDPGIMVNGKKVDDEFTEKPMSNPVDPATGSQACQGPYFGPVTVPQDNLWVMGDNRTNSLDSRGHMGDELQGTVPVENVVGRVEAIVLPFGRTGFVDNPDIQHN
nr:signal peptidase I [Corynebacterium heidelbergense]